MKVGKWGDWSERIMMVPPLAGSSSRVLVDKVVARKLLCMLCRAARKIT